MHIARQLNMLIVSFIALSVAVAGMSMAIYKGVGTLKTSTDWTRHTHEVQAVLNTGEKAYLDCETAGRLATIDRKMIDRLAPCRAEVAHQLNLLRDKVTDNGNQIANAEALKSLAEKRFQIQNKQIESAQLTDGKLVSNPELAQEAVAVHSRAVTIFQDMNHEENALLSSRFASLLTTQWQIVYFAITFLITLLISAPACFYMTFRSLRVRQSTSEKMKRAINGTLHTDSDEYVMVPVRKLQGWVQLTEQGG